MKKDYLLTGESGGKSPLRREDSKQCGIETSSMSQRQTMGQRRRSLQNTIAIGSLICTIIGTALSIAKFINKKKQKAEEAKNRISTINAKKQADLEVIEAQKNANIEETNNKFRNMIEFEEAKHKMQNTDLEDDTSSFESFCPSDYLDPKNDLKPMVGFLIPEGNDGLLFGIKGSMKSYLTINTLAQLVQGEKPTILSQEEQRAYTAPEKVHGIYINGENGPSTMKARMLPFGKKLDGRLIVLEKKDFGSTLRSFFKQIREVCIKYPGGTRIVIGMDNVKSVINGLSCNQAKEYLNGWRILRAELIEKGITLTTITICHTIKSGEKISGTYDLECLSPYALRVDKGEKGHSFLTITQARDGELTGQKRSLKIEKCDYKHHVFEMILNEPEYAEIPHEDSHKQDNYSNDVKARIVALHNEGKSFRDISEIMSKGGVTMSHMTVKKIYDVQGQASEELIPATA